MDTPKTYPSDLNDEVWAVLAPLLPKAKTGRSRLHELRERLNAIWYVLRSGEAWRMLPHDFPAWETVYLYFRVLKRSGTWQRFNDEWRTEYDRD